MTNNSNSICAHPRRSLGWSIICVDQRFDYGDDSDCKTLDAIAYDFDQLRGAGLWPILVSTGDCLDCSTVQAAMQDELVQRYRVRQAVGKVEL